jgi:hypothetical protein
VWSAAAVSATTTGTNGNVLYILSNAPTSEDAFTYNASTNTLTAGTFSGALTGTATGASNLIFGSDARGDLPIRGASSYGRLGIGTSGSVLTNNGTDPAWSTFFFSGTGTATYTFPGVTATLAALASPVFTTMVTLPHGADVPTSNAGEITIDTSTGAGAGINIYGSIASRIPAQILAAPITVKDPIAASDYPYFYVPYAVTLRAVHYLTVAGTSWTGQLQECDVNGANCVDTQAADTVAAAGVTTSVTSFSNAGIAAGVWMYLKTTSVSGSPTSVTVQADFTVDQVN